MEVVIALAIFGLLIAIAFATLDPWLGRAKQLQTETHFWRDLPNAELTLSELTADAVNLDNAFRLSDTEIHFDIVAERFGDGPLPVEIAIAPNHRGSKLDLTIAGHSADLLTSRAPLRLRVARAQDRPRILIVERQDQALWRPVLNAPFAVNGPLQCLFDPIARDCR